jgi:MOSC domain-containing protein YiiM
MAKVIAVCRSDRKGVSKEAVTEGCFIREYGLEDDAHADSAGHRQVSLLAVTSIDKMRALGLKLGPGDFAENLTIDGLDLPQLPVGTRLAVGDEVVLEVTQIGKECHTGCAIFQQVGTCVMPREGIFARVLQPGYVRPGDNVVVIDGADNG